MLWDQPVPMRVRLNGRLRIRWPVRAKIALATEGGTPGVQARGPERKPIALDGTLDTSGGAKKIHVEIATEPCTDDADRTHSQRVTVEVAGESTMQGCGDLAMY